MTDLKHIGRAVNELDKASWGTSEADQAAYSVAYTALRVVLLHQHHGKDLAGMDTNRLAASVCDLTAADIYVRAQRDCKRYLAELRKVARKESTT